MSGPGGVAGDQLRAFVERASSTWTGRSRLSRNKKDIYKAKGQGFDVKILREVIRIPKKDQKDRTRRSLCSTSTFSPQCGPPIRPAFARRLLGRTNVWIVR